VNPSESALPDETLAASAQRGDRAAFDELMRRHKDVVYRFVRRYVGNSDDAYDILQETFIAIWENLQRFDVTRSFTAWSRTIALNKCRDFSRRQKFQRLFRHLYAAEPMRRTPTPAQLAESGERDALQALQQRQLDDAIAALPAFYKEVLLLTTVGGMSQEGAAVVLGTTTKAVEMRLRRAKQRLADSLAPTQEG
jgi:RNA polymerase sigma-70 factor (ECF subfamily)